MFHAHLLELKRQKRLTTGQRPGPGFWWMNWILSWLGVWIIWTSHSYLCQVILEVINQLDPAENHVGKRGAHMPCFAMIISTGSVIDIAIYIYCWFLLWFLLSLLSYMYICMYICIYVYTYSLNGTAHSSTLWYSNMVCWKIHNWVL